MPATSKTNTMMWDGVVPKVTDKSSMLSVPDMPYTNESPKSKILDAKADIIIILNAASDDRLRSKSKLANAANGIVPISNPR